MLPYEDPANANAAKNRSHHDRLVVWTRGLVENYDSFSAEQKDYALARQIFCAQMYLSGLFRVQCFMQATDQEDYYRCRTDGTCIGIDLKRAVTRGLKSTIGFIPESDGFDSTQIVLGEIAGQTLLRNENQSEYVKGLHVSGRYDIARESSATMDTVLRLQEGWTRDVVNYVAFAAQEHGGQLAYVPFLEPKSISDDPKVYHPFDVAV
ncbi:MAG TPA: hypothetical protein VK712_04585 [Verrucomicrobiae bacterium]|nr:hypothetical protein [Verrucomicrobiae bacterium]